MPKALPGADASERIVLLLAQRAERCAVRRRLLEETLGGVHGKGRSRTGDSGAKKRLRAKRRAAGKCTQCGAELDPNEPRVKCGACRLRNAGAARALRKRRKRERICTRCGEGRPPGPHAATCVECRTGERERYKAGGEKQAAEARRTRADRKKQGRCPECGARADPNHVQCEACRGARRIRDRRLRERRANEAEEEREEDRPRTGKGRN